MRRVPLTKAEREAREKRVVAAIRQGITSQTVQARFGLTPKAVAEICRRHGVQIPYGRRWA